MVQMVYVLLEVLQSPLLVGRLEIPAPEHVGDVLEAGGAPPEDGRAIQQQPPPQLVVADQYGEPIPPRVVAQPYQGVVDPSVRLAEPPVVQGQRVAFGPLPLRRPPLCLPPGPVSREASCVSAQNWTRIHFSATA